MHKLDTDLLEKPAESRSANEPALPLNDRSDAFPCRHIGPNPEEVAEMLETVGYENIDALIDATVPKDIRLQES